MVERRGRVEDKVAIVTGAGSTPGPGIGTGKATAVVLAREGASVLLVDLHAERAEETRKLIDRAVMDALGPQGCLVNIARGSLVDQAALIDALEQKTLGGAALDVFEEEPFSDARLAALDNVLLAPHIGSATTETRQAMMDLVMANLRNHFSGQPLLTPVTGVV